VKHVFTARQVRLLEAAMGEKLEYIDVTTICCDERMLLVTTPRCEYCGRFNPSGHCRSCGACVLPDGQR
jgi:hypothetical protein